MHNRVSAWSPLSFSEPGQGFRGEEGFRALCSGALRATPVSADALHRAESFGGLGHGGVSGRYDALKDDALEQAFLLFVDR